MPFSMKKRRLKLGLFSPRLWSQPVRSHSFVSGIVPPRGVVERGEKSAFIPARASELFRALGTILGTSISFIWRAGEPESRPPRTHVVDSERLPPNTYNVRGHGLPGRQAPQQILTKYKSTYKSTKANKEDSVRVLYRSDPSPLRLGMHCGRGSVYSIVVTCGLRGRFRPTRNVEHDGPQRTVQVWTSAWTQGLFPIC